MTATTASTARKASPTKRLIALLIAFAAAAALAASIAPAAAYADESIASKSPALMKPSLWEPPATSM